MRSEQGTGLPCPVRYLISRLGRSRVGECDPGAIAATRRGEKRRSSGILLHHPSASYCCVASSVVASRGRMITTAGNADKELDAIDCSQSGVLRFAGRNPAMRSLKCEQSGL